MITPNDHQSAAVSLPRDRPSRCFLVALVRVGASTRLSEATPDRWYVEAIKSFSGLPTRQAARLAGFETNLLSGDGSQERKNYRRLLRTHPSIDVPLERIAGRVTAELCDK